MVSGIRPDMSRFAGIQLRLQKDTYQLGLTEKGPLKVLPADASTADSKF